MYLELRYGCVYFFPSLSNPTGVGHVVYDPKRQASLGLPLGNSGDLTEGSV